MKKILFLISMLCSMTAAWAGEGDGSKEHPYKGEYQASELGAWISKAINDGKYVYLDYNCVIENGTIDVFDTKVNSLVSTLWKNWAPGNIIGGNKPYSSDYEEYYKDNSQNYRETQSFIITNASVSGSIMYLRGYFSGYYGSPSDDGFCYISTAHAMAKALKDDHAKVILTDDIYMSDLGEGEAGRHTLCSTFKGNLDGDGHTIWAARPEVQHDGGGHYHRQYLFTYCDGATIKNLTIKDFRVQSEDNYNQAIITSKAMNHCVFENITLDHVSVFGNKNNVGAVTGWTEDCTFKDITVKNSDFTTDGDQAGGVVGHAIRGNFTNIKVENCEATADNDKAGGIAGRSDNSVFNGVDVSGGEIEAKDDYAGGVCGYAEGSKFISCLNSANVLGDHYVGGILGYCTGTDITRGTNSGTISHREFSEFHSYKDLGGIVGHAESGSIEQCDNYGEYPSHDDPCGGIVGYAEKMTINNCYCPLPPTNHRDAWGSIVGACKSCKVTNNLSLQYHCFGVKDYCEDFVAGSGNNFYLNDHTQDYKGLEYPDCEEYAYGLTSGEITNRLNKSPENVAAGIMPWEQELGKYTPSLGDRGFYYTRKIKNKYGTVCLPFPVKSDDKISFYEFVRATESRGSRGDDLVMEFRYVSDVAAGKPALFYVPEANGESLVDICFNNAGSDFESEPYSYMYYQKWRLEGTYVHTVFRDEDAERIYYLSNNQIHNAQATVIDAYHAYILGPSIHEVIGEGKNITFSLEDEDGTVTALRYDNENDTLRYDNENGKAYTIMGTEAPAGYKGIVIKNGKKTLSPALSR